MNALFPILAALLQAGSFTLDKVALSMRQVSFKTYVGISFPLMFLVTLVIFLIFRPPLSMELLSGNLLWYLLASIGMMATTNLMFYRALDDDDLGEIQTLDLLHNIPIIIFASVIFADERNFQVIIPSLIASLAVIWSHWEHHHVKIKKNTTPFLIWSVSAAPVGAMISKTLLMTWNPIALELVRSGALALILGPLFFKFAEDISRKGLAILVVSNILTTVAWILFYFSYQRSGIIYTVLIFSIQPLLVYLSSVFFLKEPFQWKKAAAFGIVLGSIVIAQVL